MGRIPAGFSLTSGGCQSTIAVFRVTRVGLVAQMRAIWQGLGQAAGVGPGVDRFTLSHTSIAAWACVAAVVAVGYVVFSAVAFAQTPMSPVPGSTPLSDVVTPVEQTVVPRSEGVVSEQAQAEASTEDSAPAVFSGVRGGLIAAAIAVAALAAVGAGAAGLRAFVRRPGR